MDLAGLEARVPRLLNCGPEVRAPARVSRQPVTTVPATILCEVDFIRFFASTRTIVGL